ncbi:CopG family transcriptional regulator [Agrobacterium tumefaciens]|uniref:CopG family transcriptional regulator n=1 Tax=Agrobacterium tumefaciens TaxID=358 RepID=UPI0015736996|nr:CopG family transcriptional regulator [Agrobacterium tumefaciens]NTA50681.1 CopG family transcriptional regulator [Agrobacterium tumefaciens]UXR92880.1 CopG family transcriptional regulator [Agrobacterium tumefaciens]
MTGKVKKKAQISVYLDPDVMKMLSDYAARRERPMSLVVEAAVASFLSPDDVERREALIVKRLDQIDRRMTRVERDVGISVETLAVFVRFWLATTPALPEPAAQAARAKAGDRYEAFVTALGRRLAQGPKLRQEISEDITDSSDGQVTPHAGTSRE